MKSVNVFLFAFLCSSLLIISCQKNSKETLLPAENKVSATSARESNPAQLHMSSVPYIVKLVSFTQIGSNYEWIWSVVNPNPGNGKNGTAQNLSHWGLRLEEYGCNYISQIVGAGYSSDGVSWTYFNPEIKKDPSQSCMNEPVLKFDFGTTGGAPSYYKLIVNSNNQPTPVPAYYKSGSNTGCGIFSVESIGCGFSR